jgi:hypothetical protein
MEKETLEEAALILYPINIVVDYDTNEDIRNIWIEGAKWQAERMYSEEEILVLLHKRDKHNMDNPNTFNGWLTPKEWFEKHKKK